MRSPERTRWLAHLRTISRAALAHDDPSVPFRDELGHRRRIDAPFLRWRGREADAGLAEGGSIDISLWNALASGAEVVGTVDLDEPHVGPICARETHPSIEVWTETELAALHAMWWLAFLNRGGVSMDRVRAVVRWHIEHMQPDNATNHPWALHVFLLLGDDEPVASGARLYAETLLSNCQVSMGRPDLLSAHILADAADAIERFIEVD